MAELAEFKTTLAEIDRRLKVIEFRSSVPEPFTVEPIKQETCQVTMKKVFTYEVGLAAIPEGSDAQIQVLSAYGVYLDPENPDAEMSVSHGREATTKEFKAVEGAIVQVDLTYHDAAGNASEAQIIGPFTVEDQVGPDAPTGMTIAQKTQEMIDIPEPTPEPEPEPTPEPTPEPGPTPDIR